MKSILTIRPNDISKDENIFINCSQDVCIDTAHRLNVNTISKITIEGKITPYEREWIYSGSVSSVINLTCTISGKPFTQIFSSNFKILLCNQAPLKDTMDFEIIENNTVDIGELAIQYLSFEVPFAPVKLTDKDKFDQNSIETQHPQWKTVLGKIKDNL